VVSARLPPAGHVGTRVRGVLGDLRRISRTLKLGALICGVYLVVAVTGRFWIPYDPVEYGVAPSLSPPNAQHLLGADQLGRDVLSRVLSGTSIDLFLSLTSTFIAVVIGGIAGLLSGYIGGLLDEILMRALDVIISIPILILALLVIAAAGPERSGSYALLIGVVAIVYTPRVARMARTSAVNIVTSDYVTVARARGESAWSIVWREILPNAVNVLLVEFGVRAGYAPILIGSLGFLGFGVRPPAPEWGMMISENRGAIASAPYAVLGPSIALAVLVVGLNLLSDGVARALGREPSVAR
jgi:peptide/nickel transport system permease protein